MNQWGRTYKLSVGTAEEGWEIWDLNISFEVNRSSGEVDSNNTSKVTIHNLSRDKVLAFQKPYVNIELDVGYIGTNLIRLMSGQVVDVDESEQGGDISTTLYVSEIFTELNHKIISKLIPDGRKVKDVLLEVVNSTPSLDRAVLTGDAINTLVVDGYPINGSGRSVLNDLSKTYSFDYTIDRGILYTSDHDKPTNKEDEAFLISPDTGLVGRPSKYSNNKQYLSDADRISKLEKSSKKKQVVLESGVQFTVLLNPSLVVGGLVKVVDKTYSGVYKLKEVKYYGEFMGGDWYCDCIALETNYE